jgi:hypothetical protein
MDETEEQDSEEESDKQTKLSLLWMIRRMRKIVNVEIVQAPKSTAMVIVSSHCISNAEVT